MSATRPVLDLLRVFSFLSQEQVPSAGAFAVTAAGAPAALPARPRGRDDAARAHSA